MTVEDGQHHERVALPPVSNRCRAVRAASVSPWSMASVRPQGAMAPASPRKGSSSPDTDGRTLAVGRHQHVDQGRQAAHILTEVGCQGPLGGGFEAAGAPV